MVSTSVLTTSPSKTGVWDCYLAVGTGLNVIMSSNIHNQDDCLAINKGTNIVFKGNTCNGGHGISIVCYSLSQVQHRIIDYWYRDPSTLALRFPASSFQATLSLTSRPVLFNLIVVCLTLSIIVIKLFASRPSPLLRVVQ